MTLPHSQQKLLEAERTILRLLCQAGLTGAERAENMRLLSGYRFADATHQIIFECLWELRAADRETIRQQLSARVNNKGFPDLDLDWLFEPARATPAETRQRIRTFLEAAESRSGSIPSAS